MSDRRDCGSCGTPQSAEARFCTYCGLALSEQTGVEQTASRPSAEKTDGAQEAQKSQNSANRELPSIKDKLVTVLFFAFPVFMFLIGFFWVWSPDDDQDQEGTEPTTSESQSVEERPSDISATDCIDIEGNVMTVEYTFGQAETTPAQAMAILDTSALDFEQIAARYSGSEQDWLLKMAELSRSLSEWVNSGSGDGELVFDQLMNNFGLVNQFCG